MFAPFHIDILIGIATCSVRAVHSSYKPKQIEVVPHRLDSQFQFSLDAEGTIEVIFMFYLNAARITELFCDARMRG